MNSEEFTKAVEASCETMHRYAEDWRRLAELDKLINTALGWGASLTEMVEERDCIARRLGVPLRREFVKPEGEGE